MVEHGTNPEGCHISRMTVFPELSRFIQDIQHNCDISDARDHGIYTMCTMVLKLRNLYKWEKGLQPWTEPEPADLLDWIEAKENYWATIAGEPFRKLSLAGKATDPLGLEDINGVLQDENLYYGAGFGRSMKTVFFLSEIIERRRMEGCTILILGKELAKEMAAPVAMAQDGLIIIAKESLRYFFWDQMMDVRSSCRHSMRLALQTYGVFKDGVINRESFKTALDTIVEEEMNLFIYHEIGEILQTALDSLSLRRIIDRFPGTVLEFVSRAVKDILADTHPRGLLAYILREQRESTLGFYLSLLDGLRERLFPEIGAALRLFSSDLNWEHIEKARISCWERNLLLAGQIQAISQAMETDSDEQIMKRFNDVILSPLGLEKPKE